MSHNEVVRDQFRLQASTFTDTGFAARGLDRILAEPTGLRPYRSDDGVLMLTHRWTILVATADG